MGCSGAKEAPAARASPPKAAVNSPPKQAPKIALPDNKKQVAVAAPPSPEVANNSNHKDISNDDSSGNTSTNINNSSGTSYAQALKKQQDDAAQQVTIPSLKISSTERIVVPEGRGSSLRQKQITPLPPVAVRLSLDGDDSPTQGSRSSRTSGDASSRGSDFRSDSFLAETSPTQLSSDPIKHYDENHAIYDILDNSNIDEALRRFTSRLRSKDAVAMFGISTMHGLGGREFLRADKTIGKTCGRNQMIAAEQWLRARDRERPKGSPAALLALCEMYLVNGDKEQEDECRILAVKKGFPLAELRHTAEKLEELRRSRDSIGAHFTETDAAAFLDKKKLLLQEFAELSRLSSRVGARAGKHIWKAYRKVRIVIIMLSLF